MNEAFDSDLANIEKSVQAYVEIYPGAEPVSLEVTLLLVRAATLQSGALDRFFDSMGLDRTRGRYGVLRILYFADDKRMRQFEISSYMNVTSANVTYLVDGLEKEGLVSRLPDEFDRRVSWVVLSPAGARVCETLMPGMIDLAGRIMAGFSLDEKRQFRDFLLRLRLNALREQGIS
ncbi:MAG: MarR family transcriptional regulator [Dehalococcoidia bacterium]|nr:MarR family transcriptional regulator [Dehalococcoidia bacterium]